MNFSKTLSVAVLTLTMFFVHKSNGMMEPIQELSDSFENLLIALEPGSSYIFELMTPVQLLQGIESAYKKSQEDAQILIDSVSIILRTCHKKIGDILGNKIDNRYKLNVFHYACRDNHPTVVQALLENDNTHGLIFSQNNELLTGLHCATTMGHFDIVQMILKSVHGKDLQRLLFMEALGGNTALYLAVAEKYINIIKLLLEYAGENVYDLILERNEGGLSALDNAFYLGSTDIVERFIETVGTDFISKKGCFDYTPLQSAAIRGHMKLVKYIISLVGDKAYEQIMEETKAGDTSLNLALKHGNFPIFWYLSQICLAHKGDTLLRYFDCDSRSANYDGYESL